MNIERLKHSIEKELVPLLSGRCVVLDCPYYANVGDTLIWQGTLDFLHAAGQEVLAQGSLHTWDFRALDEDVVVLLSGGGSFGDLWRPLQEFRLRVVAHYPRNKVIILPQTLYYSSQKLLAADIAALAQHPSLTVCVRDERSLALLDGRLKHVLLLPDMAFCIAGLPSFGAPRRPALLLQRRDKEAADVAVSTIPVGGEVRDWPPLERTPWHVWVLYKLSGAARRWGRFGRAADWWALHVVRPRNIGAGVRLLARYELIYSTRLHGFILALLMHKQVVLLDNSYGKNSSFAETWGL